MCVPSLDPCSIRPHTMWFTKHTNKRENRAVATVALLWDHFARKGKGQLQGPVLNENGHCFLYYKGFVRKVSQ